MIAFDDPEKIIKALQTLMRDCEKLMKLLQETDVTIIEIKGAGE